MRASLSLLLLLGLSAPAFAADAPPAEEARIFLDLYNSVYMGVSRVDAESSWASSTDVNEHNEGLRVGAETAYAAVVGDPQVIATTRRLLAQKDQLSALQVKELQSILQRAAEYPGSIPDVVAARVAAEARAAAVQDGFVFCFGPLQADGSCADPKTANDVDAVLQDSNDLSERLVAWEASKEIGRPLKPRLIELRDLRNQLAREMGYTSYFGMMVADYGMSTDEMMTLLESFVTDMDPLYTETKTWAARQFAARYHQPLPPGPVPAHWAPNRWAQEWSGLVQAADLDPYFVGKTPEWIVKTAEDFYVSMGFQPLPKSFYEKSDLYPVPEGDPRKKNSHASAWHMDLDSDIRSLMSVEANSQWFFTTHHELGHIYYYRAYARPGVPPTLREGANRAFHEGVGELITLAASQVPYLRKAGVLPKKVKLNSTDAMLDEALSQTVVFIPWSAGVMTHFEYELYEKDLPAEQWQARWWELVGKYQGVAAPTDRSKDPELCDACTKTHIIDDPAGYYDYAIATVIKYQLHEHICKVVLHQDPHSCDYSGHTEVGDFLKEILAKGATEDWRKVLKDATGEELSTRAMVDYYAPLLTWLKKENSRKR